MDLFKILTIEDIESEILTGKRAVKNFPKTIAFPFSEQYVKLVTQIKTVEISSEAILYSSIEAITENKEFELPHYWCFAGNGQGDRWFLNSGNQVFFYDHDYDEKLEPMNINFEQWLQMAFVTQQLDYYFEEYEDIPKTVKQEFYDTLNTIHIKLSEIYPFTF